MAKANEDRTFMGIKITGHGYNYHDRAEQQPIEALYPLFQELFDKGAKAVTWQQWTPGFNDGDPCEFTVGEAYITGNDEVARAWVENEDPDLELAYGPMADYYDLEDYSYYGTHPDGLDDIRLPIDAECYEDALLSTFGNYTQVIVTPQQVVQYDYDCGY